MNGLIINDVDAKSINIIEIKLVKIEWNDMKCFVDVRSLNRAGALGLVTSEIDKYRMDLVGVQEVRWEGSGTLWGR